MSPTFDPKAVSSMSSVLSSIDNDRQTYRWFLIFLSQPAIRQKLAQQEKIKMQYNRLKSIQRTEVITYLILGLVLLAAYLLKDPWALLLGILPFIALVRLFKKNRQCVVAIAEQFLLDNIPNDTLNQQTLYQTCEHLSKEHHIPSLVDIITFQDFVGRKALIAAILFVPFIYPFKSWQIFIVTFAVLLAAIAVVNMSFVLRRLK